MNRDWTNVRDEDCCSPILSDYSFQFVKILGFVTPPPADFLAELLGVVIIDRCEHEGLGVVRSPPRELKPVCPGR
jgi:hypothetical protein